MSKTIVQYMLQDDLKKRKLYPHFILHELTTDLWQQRVSHTEYLLEMIENDPHFVDLIITGNEIYGFAYGPPTKRQSAVWIGPKSPRVKKRFFQSLLHTIHEQRWKMTNWQNSCETWIVCREWFVMIRECFTKNFFIKHIRQSRQSLDEHKRIFLP